MSEHLSTGIMLRCLAVCRRTTDTSSLHFYEFLRLLWRPLSQVLLKNDSIYVRTDRGTIMACMVGVWVVVLQIVCTHGPSTWRWTDVLLQQRIFAAHDTARDMYDRAGE